METIERGRPRRSNPLSKQEYAAFIKWMNSQPTKYDAAKMLGFTLPTLDRICAIKSCSEQKITKIREIISTNK